MAGLTETDRSKAAQAAARTKARRKIRTRLNVALLALDDCADHAEGAALTVRQRSRLEDLRGLAGAFLAGLPTD